MWISQLVGNHFIFSSGVFHCAPITSVGTSTVQILSKGVSLFNKKMHRFVLTCLFDICYSNFPRCCSRSSSKQSTTGHPAPRTVWTRVSRSFIITRYSSKPHVYLGRNEESKYLSVIFLSSTRSFVSSSPWPLVRGQVKLIGAQIFGWQFQCGSLHDEYSECQHILSFTLHLGCQLDFH